MSTDQNKTQYLDVLACMRERAAGSQNMGCLPSHRSLVLITRKPATPDIAVEVVPRPEILLVSQQTIAKLPKVEQAKVLADDFSVSGIPRSFTYDYLMGVTTFLVDGVIVDGAAMDGIQCSRVTLRDGGTLTWDLVVRRKGARG